MPIGRHGPALALALALALRIELAAAGSVQKAPPLLPVVDQHPPGRIARDSHQNPLDNRRIIGSVRASLITARNAGQTRAGDEGDLKGTISGTRPLPGQRFQGHAELRSRRLPPACALIL
jgi:hypothetical protein